MSYWWSGKGTPAHLSIDSALIKGKFSHGDIFEVWKHPAVYNNEIKKWIYYPSIPPTHNLLVLHCIKTARDRKDDVFVDFRNELCSTDDIILYKESLAEPEKSDNS